jgi:phosphinothricin acetyltransferase
MSEQVMVRRATEADLPHIHRIYNDAIRDTTATWDEEPWPWRQRQAWWREHVADPTTPVFVAELADGSMAGFAYLSWYRPKSGYRFTREDTVYVDPAWQGQGLGRALLAALVGEAHALGLHVLIASIEAANEGSLRLHAALGFEAVGTEREVGFKFGRWLDATILQLRIPGSAEE